MLQLGSSAAIYGMYVSDAFRRQGIARTMMAHLLAQCRRLDLCTVVLEVDEGNAAASRLYEQYGFAQAGTSVEFRRRTPRRN
jgi:ribosomal protein S18 acetylase RimI-like enzyme